MITNIMQICFTGINSVWAWICSLWSAVGLSFPVVSIAVLTASLGVRYLLIPVIGAGAQLPNLEPKKPERREAGFLSKW